MCDLLFLRSRNRLVGIAFYVCPLLEQLQHQAVKTHYYILSRLLLLHLPMLQCFNSIPAIPLQDFSEVVVDPSRALVPCSGRPAAIVTLAIGQKVLFERRQCDRAYLDLKKPFQEISEPVKATTDQQ